VLQIAQQVQNKKHYNLDFSRSKVFKPRNVGSSLYQFSGGRDTNPLTHSLIR